jgi:hypothetical protein
MKAQCIEESEIGLELGQNYKVESVRVSNTNEIEYLVIIDDDKSLITKWVSKRSFKYPTNWVK